MCFELTWGIAGLGARPVGTGASSPDVASVLSPPPSTKPLKNSANSSAGDETPAPGMLPPLPATNGSAVTAEPFAAVFRGDSVSKLGKAGSEVTSAELQIRCQLSRAFFQSFSSNRRDKKRSPNVAAANNCRAPASSPRPLIVRRCFDLRYLVLQY